MSIDPESAQRADPKRQRVNIVAIPDAVISTLSGIYDVLNSFAMLRGRPGIPDTPPFHVEIVGETAEPVDLASGLPVATHRAAGSGPGTDILVVPSVVLGEDGWPKGRYPALVDWIAAQHRGGATICSACSGIFLIAETGLFDGLDATVHWPYANALRTAYPEIRCAPERALVVSGTRGELVSSGASTSWHDLVLYLIGRDVGPPAAQAVAKFFALQRHADGLAPFIVFDPPTDHGDGVITASQTWLVDNASIAAPVAELVSRSGLSERAFTRRFRQATGYSPLAYVQRLRLEDAKRRLERTDATVDDISWRVGYEDPSAFRRLFKRIVGVTPGAYRRQFSIPTASEASGPHHKA